MQILYYHYIMLIKHRWEELMQINASNISYLPYITHAYNGSALGTTLAYIRSCIDTQKGEVLNVKPWSNSS